ncbi:MAG: CpsD/CapB family tyrosine-protein kinase [Marinicaulis sp.]|nr:CpsD/CapB family tyrosine-protein kinase [Marinicaulis sp.]NNE39488.1 CpsD/CapB family tyrosine-protein kinase [Marinicaulis sp.]NNL89737.1 CpsD/CapB family tyrosine-protein kinase [Marinicaulis sp.]
MDRIREAISRARVSKGAAAQQPTQKSTLAPQTASAPAVEQTIASPESIASVSCDFENFSKNRIISNEQDPILNAYRVLRTRVLQKMETENWSTIAVVSPGAGAGKTVTAINLAIAMGSKDGIQPVLVDLDFYRPSVARYLGIQEFPSVLDYFEGAKQIEDVTVRPDLPNLLLMPNERVTRRGAEHLTSERADQLINAAKAKFNSRAVIFDMSPLLGCDDTLAFLPKIDCVLIVAASGQTRAHELKEAKRILRDVNVIGTVLNKAPAALMPNQYY